jgi:outer membrane protein assembly factor BamB
MNKKRTIIILLTISLFISISVIGCGHLYGQTPGDLKWIFHTSNIIFSSPVIGLDGTIYVGSDDHNLYAINPDGTEKWRFLTANGIRSSPAIDSDGTIYTGSADNCLYAINPGGTEKWKFMTGDWVFSSPAISFDGTIYVGSDDQNLYAINPDGSEKWRFPTGDIVDSSPAIGLDGTIYVGSYFFNLYAIYSNSYGLACSFWPKFHHDSKNTGRIGSYCVPQTRIIVFMFWVFVSLSIIRFYHVISSVRDT